MSATDHRPEPASGSLEDLPEFELASRYDDEDEPTEVTVFPAGLGEDLATTWLTVDVEHAVPLDQVR